MSSQVQRHFEDWDLFALGVLDDEEMRAMTGHLASGCPLCNSRYTSVQLTLAGLATTVPDVQLPADYEQHLRQRLEGERAAKTAPTTLVASKKGEGFWRVFSWLATAACLLAVIGLSSALIHARRQLHQFDRTAPEARIESLQQEVKDLQLRDADDKNSLKTAQERLAEAQERTHELEISLNEVKLQILSFQRERSAPKLFNDRMIALLQSAPLSQLDLKPAVGVNASARLFWKNDRGLLLVARDLPHLRNGSLQLWFSQKSGLPVNVGKIAVDPTGTGLLFVAPGSSLDSMAGAMITEQSDDKIASEPGNQILNTGP